MVRSILPFLTMTFKTSCSMHLYVFVLSDDGLYGIATLRSASTTTRRLIYPGTHRLMRSESQCDTCRTLTSQKTFYKKLNQNAQCCCLCACKFNISFAHMALSINTICAHFAPGQKSSSEGRLSSCF